MTKWLLGPFILIAILLGVLILLPSPIDAVAFAPGIAPPMIGKLAPNQLLDRAELLAKGEISGPEDVDADPQGRIYGGTLDGRIIRIDAQGHVTTLARTGGRPLGMDWDSHGNLIICDAFKGLLSLSPSGELNTLLREVDGIPLNFPDDVEIARDGKIYFSDASTRHDLKHHMLDMFEARPWGHRIEYDPTTGKARTLLKGLYFANGIALSKDDSFVLVNETYRYRITRYWLKGPKSGQHDIFIDNLPGFPDGVSSSGRGTFWVALPTVRNHQLDSLHPHPLLKNLVAKLPDALRPTPPSFGLVLELDENAGILRSLQDPDGNHYPFITSAQERDGALYLGSLENDSIARLSL